MRRVISRSRAAIALAIGIAMIATASCRRGPEKTATTSALASPATSVPGGTAPASAKPVPAAKPLPIVTPINPEVLKSVMPEISGWTRGTLHGALLAAPAAFSKAEVRYERVPITVHVEVQDTALNQVLLSGMTMFLTKGYEERSADGHKKSGVYSGHPAFEEWKRDARRGEINVLVAQRFVVSAIGQRLDSMSQLAEVVNALDFAKLK